MLVDIPGTYSIMSNSEEEEIARDYICFGNPNVTIIVVDATCIERNLNLVYQIMEITPNIIVCVNLLDEAKKKKIKIDLNKLEEELKVPVVGTVARSKKTLKNLMRKIDEICMGKIKPKPNLIKYENVIENEVENIKLNIEKKLPEENKYLTRWIALKIIDGDDKILKSIQKNLKISVLKNKNLQNKLKNVNLSLKENGINKENFKERITSSIISEAEKVCSHVVKYEDEKYSKRERKIDKILTSKIWGIPIMILFLGIILWITIIGANYPSQALSNLFGFIGEKLEAVFLFFNAPSWLRGVILDGMYKTLTWVISVMLPPMAIFFPLFTLLEDLGVLPRISFNLDKCFKKACTSRKTSFNNVYGASAAMLLVL